MQNQLNRGILRERVLKATNWQEHQRLLFDAIHNQDRTVLGLLLTIYRESVKNHPSLLLRWAYANCSIEIGNNNINALKELEYKLDKLAFDADLSESKVIDEYKKLIREAPKQVLGYLGLARAYRSGFMDSELAGYTVIEEDKEIIIEVNGKKQKVRYIRAGPNPERWRRISLLEKQIAQIEPQNPFLFYWNAEDLYWNAEDLVDFTKGFELIVKAYQLGMKQFYPIPCLMYIIWFAWKANRREDMERYGEELRRWMAQAPRSAYSHNARLILSRCPVVNTLPR